MERTAQDTPRVVNHPDSASGMLPPPNQVRLDFLATSEERELCGLLLELRIVGMKYHTAYPLPFLILFSYPTAVGFCREIL
jgi:hypothetical protein